MKIVEKLKKLIRHEQSARAIGNLGEAKNFAEKIQELLDAHNLSFSQIDIETAQSSVDRSSDGQHSIHKWQKVFIIGLAEINGCQVVFDETLITLIGSEDDRLIVFEIYRYFEKLGRDLAAHSLNEWKLTAEYKRKRKKTFHSKSYKTSFLRGFVYILTNRFQERHDQAKKSSSNEQALIFIGNKLAEANKWIEKNIQVQAPKPIVFKRSSHKTDAFSKGVKAGKSVALTTQTIS